MTRIQLHGTALEHPYRGILNGPLRFLDFFFFHITKDKKLQERPQRQAQTIIKQKKDHKRPTINTQERGPRLRPETEPPPNKTRTQHVFNDEG